MSKNITLKVDEKIYAAYKSYCKKRGLVISRQFEIMAEKQMQKDKENGE